MRLLRTTSAWSRLEVAARSRIIAAAATAAVVAAAATCAATPAFAMPPSPRLLAKAAKDPALARSLAALFARQRAAGIDAARTVNKIVRKAAGVYEVQAAPSSPAPGPNKMLVLLIDFPDHAHSVVASFFDTLVFDPTVGPSSVNGFYRQVSYGKVSLTTSDAPSAVDWIRLSHNYSYYTGSGYADGTGSYPNNAQAMVEEAVQRADAAVNFAVYDTNHDGVMDAPLVVVHAGTGAELGGTPGNIWSHAWNTYSPPVVDGVRVDAYCTVPEFWQTPGDQTTGVYCHEIGHLFGLPDLYDTNPYNGSSQGLGKWSLMAGGSWNGALGATPSRPDAWCEIRLGFATPTTVTTGTAATIPPVDTASTGRIVRIGPRGASSGPEYFLAENRYLGGTDVGLPGRGLLIYHVDERQSGNGDASHYMVGLEEAHGGTQDLAANLNAGDANDPFPTASQTKRAFGYGTDPSSSLYSGQPSYVDVSNISYLVAPGAPTQPATMTAQIGFPPPPPDLIASLASIPPSAHPGEALSVAWRVDNLTAGTAGASELRIVCSRDAVVDASDVVLATVPTPPMGGAGSTGGTVAVTLPSDLAVGQVYLIATANYDGAVAELSYSNNSVAVPLTVRVPMPDLAMSLDTVPARAYPGSTFTVSWTVRNVGAAAAPPSAVEIVFSSNTVIDGSDPVLVAATAPALSAGAEASGRAVVSIPGDAPVNQTAEMLAECRLTGAVTEIDGANNLASRPVWIDPLSSTRFGAVSVRGPARVAGRVVISGRLFGAPAHARVAIQVFARGRFKTRVYAYSRSGGTVRAALRLKAGDRGRRGIRLLYAGAVGVKGCASRPVWLRVR